MFKINVNALDRQLESQEKKRRDKVAVKNTQKHLVDDFGQYARDYPKRISMEEDYVKNKNYGSSGYDMRRQLNEAK